MAMKANPFRAVRAESLGDQISRQLLSAIVQGHYPEGANLPCERELAGAFQVSVIAVREALSRLRHLGIVAVRQGRGTTVNPAAQWNTLAPEVFLAIHTNQAFEQLLAVRVIIEPECAGLAAQNATPEHLARLKELMSLSESDSVERHVERDTSFHLEIAKATGNPVLLTVFNAINVLLRESRSVTYRVAGGILAADYYHRQLYRAIADGQAETAQRVMRDHLAQVGETLREYRKLSAG